MCLAVPGRVLSVAGGVARVDFGGIERETALDLLPGTRPGDYVIVHAGFAIQRMNASEAAETLSLFREIAEMEP